MARIVCPTKYPMIFGYSEAGIASGSMEPTLSQGDHIIFKEQDDYGVNDVIVYYDPTDGLFVVHRIVGTNNGDFIVQGDYSPECDPNPVKTENIQGKVVYVIPNLQPILYIGFGSAATILIQSVKKMFKVMSGEASKVKGEQENEE